MLNFAKDLAAALDALRRHAILFVLAVAIVALALLGRSWLDARDSTARLQSTLAAQQKTITDADARQSTRDAQLAQTLTQITAAKQKVQTPGQAAAALPQAVSQLISKGPSGKSLPSPITIEIPAQGFVAQVASSGLGPLDANHSTTANANGSSVPALPSSAAAKHPWTTLKSKLAKLGIGHAVQLVAELTAGSVRPQTHGASDSSAPYGAAQRRHTSRRETYIASRADPPISPALQHDPLSATLGPVQPSRIEK